MSHEHPTGIYKVISSDGVYVRREARIVENNKITNRVGKLSFSTTRRVYETITDKQNYTWGRVSESDAAGIAEWTCLEGLNRTYMECVEPDPDPVEALSTRIAALEARVIELESKRARK